MARHASPCPASRPSSLTFEQIASLLDRHDRDRTRLFWAEGCRSFFSALENGWDIRSIIYCPRLLSSRPAWERLRRLGTPSLELSSEEFGHLTRRAEPDGVGVVCAQHWERLIEQPARRGDVWVALDSIRTPGNLGTIFRTCAAVGARGVMVIGGEIDAFDPAVIRSSMGAIFSVDLIRTSARALAGWKSRRQVLFVGASPAGSLDYRQACYRSPLVLMMGSERSGLRERQIALCDQIVSLPMTPRVDSLNLAVAAGLMLYEAIRDG